MIRFNKNANISLTYKETIKIKVSGNMYIGHENAFSVKVPVEELIPRIKEIDGIISSLINS